MKTINQIVSFGDILSVNTDENHTTNADVIREEHAKREISVRYLLLTYPYSFNTDMKCCPTRKSITIITL